MSKRMPVTDDAILMALWTHGASSAGDLVPTLERNESHLWMRLRDLEKRGYLTSTTRKQKGRGRNPTVYRIHSRAVPLVGLIRALEQAREMVEVYA